jgi:DNA-binding transcriptional MocR family regulator
MLMRSAAQSLTEQLAERFAARIRDRLLAPGSRLPSVRQCATQHQLSPSTVVAAYDQLLAQGLIEARPQRGFFVRDWTPKPALPSADGSPSAIEAGVSRRPAGLEGLAAPIKATALIRGMFHPTGSKPQPGMGVFPPDWLATNFMTAAVRKVTSSAALQESSLKYGEPLGDGDLRRVLSARLMGLGLPAAPGQIITTVGARTRWTS